MNPYLPPVHGSMRWIFRPDARSGVGYQATTISGGDAGTRQTVERMIKLAQEGAAHPGIREASERAVRLAGVAPKDTMGEFRALYDYVRANVRYVLDPRDVERIAHPAYNLFVSGQGDCDEMQTVLASMAGAIGHGAAFRTVKADPQRPDEYSHVYTLLGLRGPQGVQWIPADVTQQGVSLGWEPPAERVFAYRDWLAIPP